MPSGNGKVDVELDNIISRISHVQKKLGGTVTDGAPTAFIGDDGKVDRFEELKSIIKGHFDDLQKLTDDIVELKQDNNRESTTERIQKEQNHRKVMGQLDAEVKELDELQRGEGKKKRSKYTRADLEIRASEAALLRRKLEDTKEFSRRGFVGNREGYATNRIVDMKDSELFK